MDFTEAYPNKAPKVRFITKMYHPNSKHHPACCQKSDRPDLPPIGIISSGVGKISSEVGKISSGVGKISEGSGKIR